MRWQSQVVASVLATMLIGCGPRDNAGQDTGTAGDAADAPSGMTSSPGMTDTSSVGGTAGTGTGADTGTDTAMSGRKAPSDSAKGNQSESGVTNTETGKATTGGGVTKTRPDQGQPVTSKVDTVSRTGDSATQPPR